MAGSNWEGQVLQFKQAAWATSDDLDVRGFGVFHELRQSLVG